MIKPHIYRRDGRWQVDYARIESSRPPGWGWLVAKAKEYAVHLNLVSAAQGFRAEVNRRAF